MCSVCTNCGKIEGRFRELVAVYGTCGDCLSLLNLYLDNLEDNTWESWRNLGGEG